MNVTPSTTFVLVNENAGPDVTQAFMENTAAAIDHVLQHSFRSAWGGSMRCRSGGNAGSSGSAVGPNEVKVQLEASSDIPGAGGYHDDGAIHCFRDGAGLLGEFDVIISHEIFETAVDPGANRWAYDGKGAFYALEASDAVEGFSFVSPIAAGQPGAGVSVSDFVLPSFFDPSGVRPFSRCDKPTAPFTTASDGGADYQIVLQTDDSGAQQVTAIGNVHPNRRGAKSHPSSRSTRRGLKLAPPDLPTKPAAA